MTYKMMIVLLSAFCAMSIAIIVISSIILHHKMKNQVKYAEIVCWMANIQMMYTKLMVDGALNKYPNINKVLKNTTHTFEKILDHSDFDCKGIAIQKGIMPGLDIDKFTEELLRCPHHLRKIVGLNTRILMDLSRIKRPFLFWWIKITSFFALLPVRLATLFPNTDSKKRPKSEKKMIENIRQDNAAVGMQ